MSNFDTDEKGPNKPAIAPGNAESPPISVTEKLVREEIKKLSENSEELKRLKEQMAKKTKHEESSGQK